MNSVVAARVVAAAWLGQGRRMEAFLVIVAGLYAILLFFLPHAAEDSKATIDLYWDGYGHYLFFPLLAKSIISGYGLLANITGQPYSRLFRFAGAVLGFFIWTWFVVKFALLGILPIPGFVFTLVAALYGELGVIFMSAANLPRPGAPGNVGLAM